MKRLIIHIGLHKTGTTYLQEVLFPAMPGVVIIRGWYSHRKLFKSKPKSTTIISDESISGSLWSGNYGNDFKQNIEKINAIYHNPKIIMGIRNQLTFVESVYKQYLQEGGTGDFEEVFNINNTGLLKHDDLLLVPKIMLLKNTFSDVFIYSQETLLKNNEFVIAALKEFINISKKIDSQKLKSRGENVSVNTVLQIKALKYLNSINSSFESIHPALSLYGRIPKKLGVTPRVFSQKFLRRFSSPKFKIDENVREFIKGYYDEDWKHAQKELSY